MIKIHKLLLRGNKASKLNKPQLASTWVGRQRPMICWKGSQLATLSKHGEASVKEGSLSLRSSLPGPSDVVQVGGF